MNNCILMAEIIQEPELRYTSDSQTPIAEMLVQFAGLRPEDPASKLKVIGWGNLAQEIQANYHEGDRIVIEGRLSMNTLERPEGFKEKRAELTAQRIHRLNVEASFSPSPTPTTSAASPAATSTGSNTAPGSGKPPSTPRAKSPVAKFAAPPDPIAEPNLDDIPF